MTTLREHLEAIRDYYAPNLRAHEHAVAALAILNEAERRSRGTREQRQSTDYLYVYDPEPPA